MAGSKLNCIVKFSVILNDAIIKILAQCLKQLVPLA